MAVLYDDPQREASAEAALRSLFQGRRPVEEYITDFRNYAADTQWNQAALKHQFRIGLSEVLKDELARVGVPDELESLVGTVIQIDRRLRERRLEKSGVSQPSWLLPKAPLFPKSTSTPPMAASSLSEEPEPMQIGLIRSPLTPEERLRRRRMNLCLYCGASGHLLRSCPVRPNSKNSAPVLLSAEGVNGLSLMSVVAVLQWSGKTLQVPALIDSGACGCFIDREFARLHCIPLKPRSSPLMVKLADGSDISSGPVLIETFPLLIKIQKHSETLSFDVVSSPLYPLILGFPWLKAHNPLINWDSNQITFPSGQCSRHDWASKELSVLSSDPRLKLIPESYHEFLDVFDERGADVLPPHRIYDCPVDLLPGAAIPFGRIYPLSEPELTVLKDYIEENLK
uniref:CCHC-type domain-containing protein n=1 Tax=Xenopus tropicalis TaxID=8364 RepID=A0A6I8SYT0_XENTR